jgi:hypothetical protein
MMSDMGFPAVKLIIQSTLFNSVVKLAPQCDSSQLFNLLNMIHHMCSFHRETELPLFLLDVLLNSVRELSGHFALNLSAFSSVFLILESKQQMHDSVICLLFYILQLIPPMNCEHLFTIDDCGDDSRTVIELLVLGIDFFELYLNLSTGIEYIDLIFDNLWRLSLSPCREISCGAVKVLCGLRCHEKSFHQGFISSHVADGLTHRLELMVDSEDFSTISCFLTLFARITRLNSVADNLILMFNENIIPTTLTTVICKSELYLPSCQIMYNLLSSGTGVLKRAFDRNLISPFLDMYCSEMDLQSKEAAGLIFAHAIAHIGSHRIGRFFEYENIMADFPDFCVIATGSDLTVLLRALLKMLKLRGQETIDLIGFDALTSLLDELPVGENEDLVSQIESTLYPEETEEMDRFW